MSLDTQDTQLYLVEWLLLHAGLKSFRSRIMARLDLVFGWLVVMHTYLHYFPSSLYDTLHNNNSKVSDLSSE